jgi:acetoin utilization deacetylase AcuC-like enzyme
VSKVAHVVAPALRPFRPDVVVVPSGFDASSRGRLLPHHVPMCGVEVLSELSRVAVDVGAQRHRST